MARALKRTVRPFRPYDLDHPLPPGEGTNLPTCGVGKERQIDIHNFNLFDVAARETGMYSKELADLTRKLNVLFRREGKAALLRKQKELDDRSIMLTIALHEGGLYLTYARPARKRPQRRLAPSRLQTRQAARRS